MSRSSEQERCLVRLAAQSLAPPSARIPRREQFHDLDDKGMSVHVQMTVALRMILHLFGRGV